MDIPFDINGKNVEPFEETDPFNNDNKIKGYIYRNADMKYGMLYITHVNDIPAEQIIWATPKMHYPVDKNGNYHFDKEIQHIEVYEKLDGTNILAYIYRDHNNKPFVTYKTRLRPVIKDGKFGRFETLWKEMLIKYPTIPELCLQSNCSVSWELYGKRNKVLIDYPHSLDAKILFFRNVEGVVIAPSFFTNLISTLNLQNQVTPLITMIDGHSDLPQEYAKITAYLNEHIKITQIDDTQNLVEGMEGSMWYAINDNHSIQYKCKPDYVRDIHFLASEGIPKHSIFITCVNAFEETDNPTPEYIKKLLLEEFQESEIERKWNFIENTLKQVTFRMKIKSEIIVEYQQHPEFDMISNKGTVMRHFAKKYDKTMCKLIFELLNEEYGQKY